MSEFKVGDKVRHINEPYGIGEVIDIKGGRFSVVVEWPEHSTDAFIESYLRHVSPERSNILTEADTLINGDRARDYGRPQENFGRLAELWNAQLGKKLAEPLTTQDVAYCLVQLKMSRLANTPGHRDSLIDVAGYIALSGELE